MSTRRGGVECQAWHCMMQAVLVLFPVANYVYVGHSVGSRNSCTAC